MNLDLEILGINHSIVELRNSFPDNYADKEEYIDLENKLKVKLTLQKKVDYYRYRLNCQKIKSYEIKKEISNQDRYNKLNISIKEIINKHNYDYIKDESGIFSGLQNPNCDVVKEVNHARLMLHGKSLRDFYNDRDWKD
ncbi:MAG: hypothetical protein ACNI25_01895 [Halarcobacter sp.]